MIIFGHMQDSIAHGFGGGGGAVIDFHLIGGLADSLYLTEHTAQLDR